MARLLVIDDDPEICGVVTRLAKGMGHEASSAVTLEDGLSMASSSDFDVILLDLQFPGGNGLDILPDLIKIPSRPEVIIITGSGVQAAELAFKYGAWDYIQKPFLVDEITLPITRALQYRNEKESRAAPLPLKCPGIIGESSIIKSCLQAVARASASEASVLITGETGTGKELFATAIHENSRRSQNNFIVVDCGALPETLVESILFGHEKGAFTGADKGREGLIRQAEGGMIFLDEIGDLPYDVQKSLLRTLQEKRIRPIGSKQEITVDFRLVAATNRDLSKMMSEGTFREDLMFRISAMEIRLPPLRERGEDIREIAIQKVQRLCRQYGMDIKGISEEFLQILQSQHWPGNVRELINVLENSLASAGGDPTLIPKHIPYQYRAASLRKDSQEMPQEVSAGSDAVPYDQELKPLSEFRAEQWNRLEREYLLRLVGHFRGDREKACSVSGLSQSQLYALLKKHDLSRFRS